VSKLAHMATKELAELQEVRNVTIKAIEQTQDALKSRQEYLKKLDSDIAELQEFLNPKKTKGKK
jgi:hypothetical protein